MNSSLVVDYPEFPPFSRRDLYILIGGGIVSAAIGLYLTEPFLLTRNSAPLLNSVDIVSKTFAAGLFFFLTAGLLFSSHTSRQYFLSRLDKGRERRVLVTRVLHVVLITGLFTTAVTLIAFVKPIILGEASQYTISFSHLVYLPSVLASSLIVSTFLAVLASSLAVVTDDTRLSVVLGCASTLIFALVAGWSSDDNPLRYSPTRNIALLSPHNIVRALAVQLSGYQFESTWDMVRYVGFAVSVEGLVIALLILGSISIVLLLVGQRALAKNSTRWVSLPGMIPVHEVWSSAATLQEISRIKRSLRLQRGLTTLIVGVLLVSMFVGGSSYSSYIVNSTTIVHYQTPGTREDIPVGSWIVFDVDVQPPYPGFFNLLFFRVHIETLGNTSGTVSLYFGILEMNSTEFDLLEESIRFDLLSSRLNLSYGVGYGVGEGLEESYGSYICVLKFISDAAPSEKSYVKGTLEIIQEAY